MENEGPGHENTLWGLWKPQDYLGESAAGPFPWLKKIKEQMFSIQKQKEN